MKVTGSTQMVPMGLLEPTVQPVIAPILYSWWPPWEVGTPMLEMVSVAVVARLTFCAALLVNRLVKGRETMAALAVTLRIRLS